MKRLFGIGFYWGQTQTAVCITIGNRYQYEMRMYGISIQQTFIGIFVRGNLVDVI